MVAEETITLIGWVASGFHVLGALTAVDAIMNSRSPQGSTAWAVSLLTFPYLTLPLYWVFGRSKFNGYVDARRVGELGIHQIALQLKQHEEEHRSQWEQLEEETQHDLSRISAVEQLAKMPFTAGNRTDLLIDGKDAFEAIFAAMEAAKDYVLVQFFIVKDDRLGNEFQQQIEKLCARGVRVYFLFDEIGSYGLPSAWLRKLRRTGAVVHAFHTRKGLSNRFQINFRNHRKIVVVDGEIAFVGGLNIGVEYLGEGPLGAWRDTHCSVVGPSVQCVQLSFLEDWHWATQEVPELNWVPKAAEGGDVDVLVLPSGPADNLETCNLFFIHAINSARDRIWIASPYFVPGIAVVDALRLAGLRGVDVRILLPEKPDHKLVYLASFSYLTELDGLGIRIMRYQPGFMHQKTFLIDEGVAMIGTANLDNRSFRLNFEITMLMIDREFGKEVEQMFLRDFERSREVTALDLERRPFWFKLAVRTSRLLAPIL